MRKGSKKRTKKKKIIFNSASNLDLEIAQDPAPAKFLIIHTI